MCVYISKNYNYYFIKPLISNFSLRSRVALRLKRYRGARDHVVAEIIRPSHRFARHTLPRRNVKKLRSHRPLTILGVMSRRSFFVEGQKRVEPSRARNKRELERARRKDRLSTMRCDKRNKDRMRRIKPPTERGIRKREKEREETDR